MNIEIIDILFLPMIVFLGAITSWEDYNYKLVRNKWIIIGLIYGAGAFFLMSLPASITAISPQYLGKVIFNSIIALFVSLFFWKNGLLAAGDAKLFFLFSFLLPLKYYQKSYLPIFPSLVLLINIYVVTFLFILAKAFKYNFVELIKDSRNGRINFNKSIINLKTKSAGFFKNLFGLMIIFIIVNNIFNYLKPWLFSILNEKIIIILLLFIARHQLVKLIKNQKIYIILISLFFLLFALNSIELGIMPAFTQMAMSLKISAQFIIIFMLIKSVLDNYLSFSSKYKINIDELKPMMTLDLSEKTIQKIGPISGGGLSFEQADSIKKWCANNNIKEVKVYKKFPFAIWIFISTIITIIYGRVVIDILLLIAL